MEKPAEDEDPNSAKSPGSTDEFFALVYSELRRIASVRLSRELHQTIGATDLVNEAYVRLVQGRQEDWANRYQFFAAAALAMRRILVERARHRNAKKRPRIEAGYSLTEFALIEPKSMLDVLAVDEALNKLAKDHPRQAELVQLRFFAGLTVLEAAKVLGVSSSTADNDWAYAKTWLGVELSGKK